ncbi:MAG: hypothetical protein ACR2PT_17770 [Endozoicomonas sp.]
MRRNLVFLLPFLLAGCAGQQHQKEEAWEAILSPEGQGIYSFEGRFIERKVDEKGVEQSSSTMNMPAVRFRFKEEGGIAEIGGEGYGLTTEVQVQSRDSQRSVNYFMEWYRGDMKRSTRGTIHMQD